MARARRAKGTGSYDKVGGSYRWRIGIFDPISGKTKYKSLKNKNREKLRQNVAAWLEAHADDDSVPVSKRMKVGAWAKFWIESIASKRAPQTANGYRQTVNRHILPNFGELQLSKVTPKMLQEYFDDISKTLAPSTVSNIRGHFRTMFSKAVAFGYLSKNPAVVTEPPPFKKPDLVVLDDDSAARLLAVAKSEANSVTNNPGKDYLRRRDYMIILLALASGMRKGELLGLTWDCVHGSMIEVKHSLQILPGAGLKSPKNGKPRTIYIPDSVAVELAEWHDYQSRYAAEFEGVYNNPLSFVFTTQTGSTVDSSAFVRRNFAPIARAAGVEGLRVHDLRHYWASSALARGVSITAVSEQLGHASIEITLRRYTHVLQKSKDELKRIVNDMPIFSHEGT